MNPEMQAQLDAILEKEECPFVHKDEHEELVQYLMAWVGQDEEKFRKLLNYVNLGGIAAHNKMQMYSAKAHIQGIAHRKTQLIPPEEKRNR